MKVLLAGQKWLGAEVLRALLEVKAPTEITAVCAPGDDRLRSLAEERRLIVHGPGLLAGPVVGAAPDLIVCAHHHGYVSKAWRKAARYGAVGYHPSLLPVHRGRDAVEWTIRCRDRIAGGTVYRLTGMADAGPVIIQRHVHVRPDDTAATLWRRSLGPLGVSLLIEAVTLIAVLGDQAPAVDQEETCATWEPALEVPSLRRRGAP